MSKLNIKIKRGIALSLVGITILIPVMNTAYALEKNNSETNEMINENDSEEKRTPLSNSEINSAKKSFQEINGSDDIFKKALEKDNKLYEVNGYRGIIRVSTYNENKEIVDTIEINYFENLDSVNNDFSNYHDDENYDDENHDNLLNRSARSVSKKGSKKGSKEVTVLPTYKTKSPDPFSIGVKGGGNYKPGYKYKIRITNWYSYRTKTYYKKGNWDTGNTNGFYNCLKSVNSAVDIVVASIGFKAFQKLFPLLKNFLIKGKSISTGTIVDLLSVAGITIIGSPYVIAGSIALYCVQINRAQYFFNQI